MASYGEFFADQVIAAACQQTIAEQVNTAALCVEKASVGEVVVNDDVRGAIGKFVDPKPKIMNVDAVRAITTAAKEAKRRK